MHYALGKANVYSFTCYNDRHVGHIVPICAMYRSLLASQREYLAVKIGGARRYRVNNRALEFHTVLRRPVLGCEPATRHLPPSPSLGSLYPHAQHWPVRHRFWLKT